MQLLLSSSHSNFFFFFFFSFSFFFSCVFLWFFLSEKNCAPRVLSVYNLYLIPFPSFLHSDSFFNSSSYLVSFFLQFINSSSFFCFFFCSEMRRHGWELPYHPLQVVAIAVFLALGFAFFVFFLPFVGSHVMEIVVSSVYAPLIASVFILYIWCASCDPSDPAILRMKRNFASSASKTTSPSVCFTGERDRTSTEPTQPSSTHSKSEHAHCEEDMLYCSLCEVEIRKRSKHCRVCDKCVDCFDHHCRWLNNCIGKRNYRIFISLMISGVCMLIVQWAVGVWVIARCFLDRRQFEEDISSKLGSSFSVAPFLCVVAVCTVLAAFATLPLGQLCLFHALLIQKGISTYDYILAMRERDQLNGAGERLHSPYASPASSVATAMSGASSMGTLHPAPWCTPPRLFVDHEQAPIELERIKSINSESTFKKPHLDNKVKKLPAKISPWALARLNPEDAFRAVAEARKNSSVLRPIPRRAERCAIVETDSSDDYTSNEVTRGSPSIRTTSRVVSPPKTQDGFPWPVKCKAPLMPLTVPSHGNKRLVQTQVSPSRVSASLVPLQLEARNAFCGNSNIVLQSSSSRSSSESPDIRLSCDDSKATREVSCYNENGVGTGAWFRRCTSDGYEASGGESADDSDRQSSYPRLQSYHVGHVKMETRMHYSVGDSGLYKTDASEKCCGNPNAILGGSILSSAMMVMNPMILNESMDSSSSVSGAKLEGSHIDYGEIGIPDIKLVSVGTNHSYDLPSSASTESEGRLP